MNSEELRDQCLSFLGSEEEFPFGAETSVFKVAGKIFATLSHPDDAWAMVKLTPEQQDELVRT